MDTPIADEKLKLRSTDAVTLTIAADIDLIDRTRVATSKTPWLRVDVDCRALAGRWIRLSYRSGLLDPLARPVIRFLGTGSAIDQPLPAALFGRMTWLGRVPDATTTIWISPTNRPGPFAFDVERIEVRSKAALTWALARRAPKRALIWLFAPLVGMPRAAYIQIKRVLSGCDLDAYDAWRRQGTRALDLCGFDGPMPNRHVRFVIEATGDDPEPLGELLACLRAQPCPHWSLAIIGPAGGASASTTGDGRLRYLAPDAPLAAVLDGLDAADLVAPLHRGDLLPPLAVASWSRAAQAQSEAQGFFGDSDTIDADGQFGSPRLMSDWNSVQFDATGDLGPAIAIRARVLQPDAQRVASTVLAALPAAFADQMRDGRCPMHHVRRVLLTTSPGKATRQAAPVPRPVPALTLNLAPARLVGSSPRATIIIPTRDKLDLLRACVGSLQRTMSGDQDEVIVVDNGSIEPETKAFLADLAGDTRFRVLADHGAFNFSRLCNRAAGEARASTLVFLNNDTEVIDASWLDPLVAWATRPAVGAVGAKLLYPSGHVQHAGVVIGIDGFAGHFERGCARDDPGFFGRLTVPHEVSAVTAACLAVEARKFVDANGFDEINLPVDLNDIDLCLRLNARGWATVLVPGSVLIHREAASRGVSHQPYKRYRQEQETFKARWADTIRDDPHFHPALSLDALAPRLG